MAEAGRPTELNDKLCLEIRRLVLEGKNYEEIRELLGIPKGTWDNWHADNYQAFAERLAEFKKEQRLMKAERNIDEILDLEVQEPVITMIGVLKDTAGKEITKINPNLLRIKQDTSKFVAETIGKEDYSKRNELTGKGGKDIPVTPAVINIIKPSDVELQTVPEAVPGVALPDGQADD